MKTLSLAAWYTAPPNELSKEQCFAIGAKLFLYITRAMGMRKLPSMASMLFNHFWSCVGCVDHLQSLKKTQLFCLRSSLFTTKITKNRLSTTHITILHHLNPSSSSLYHHHHRRPPLSKSFIFHHHYIIIVSSSSSLYYPGLPLFSWCEIQGLFHDFPGPFQGNPGPSLSTKTWML